MIYQAPEVREFRSGAEMKAAYQAARKSFYGDSEVIAALRATIFRERQERKAEVEKLTDEIAALKADKAEIASRLSYFIRLPKDEPPPFIDRVKYAFPRVLAAICVAHKVAAADVKSHNRQYYIVRARMHLIHILTVHRPDLSTPVIGSLINRDHSTVINARYRWPHVYHKVAWQILEFEREIEKETKTE